MEDLDEFEGGEEVDYDFNLDDDFNDNEEAAEVKESKTNDQGPAVAKEAAAAAESAPEAQAEAQVQPESTTALAPAPAAAQYPTSEPTPAAIPAPAPVKAKHKFTGLEDLDAAVAAPAAYQPPTQEQLIAEKLQQATNLAREQKGRGPMRGLGRPFVPNSQSNFRGGGRGGRGGPPTNSRPAGGPRLPDRRLGESRGRGDAQRGGRTGRGMGGRNGRQDNRGPSLPGPPSQDGRQQVRGPSRGPQPPRPPVPPPQGPPKGPWMPGGRMPALGSGPQRGLNPSAAPFLPMPPGLPMPNGLPFGQGAIMMGGKPGMQGLSDRMRNGRDYDKDGISVNPVSRLAGRLSGGGMQWEDCRSDPLGRYAENGRQSGGRKTGRDAWEAGDGDWDSGRGRSGPPKLAGDFDAGEEFEPPKKRAVSDLRGLGGSQVRPGLALPPMDRPRDGLKAPPSAADIEAEKAKKRQEEEEARKAAIQRRIEAQKEENALLARLRELERQVELNKIRESIARLEAEQAKSNPPAATATAPAVTKTPLIPAKPQKVASGKLEAEPAAGRKPQGSAQEGSHPRRRSGGREESGTERGSKRSRTPPRSPSPNHARSRSRQTADTDAARSGRLRARLDDMPRRADDSSRHNNSRGQDQGSSQDLREYLEQKKQRAKRNEESDHRTASKWTR